MTSAYEVRALEFHDSSHIWNIECLRKTLKFMVDKDLNTLVLHQVDIIDEIVYPGRVFGISQTSNIHETYEKMYRTLYRYAPRRRGVPNMRKGFLRLLVQEALRFGIKVYLENKEIWFPDMLLEFYPHLIKKGTVCPSEEFWWEEFLPAKYEELFQDFPELAGVVISTATGESRVSISQRRCECEKCKKMDPVEWHHKVITSIYEALKKAKKQLVIRDFVFNKEAHQVFTKVISRLPEDIVVSIKNTPHDYYPTFPHNPLIGKTGGRPQWLEFDAMAQYFGWGIGISVMLEDLRDRMLHGLEKGATGFLVRTDLESLPNHSCFRTPNLINLYGAAQLGKDPLADFANIYRRWLSETRMFEDGSSPEDRKKCVKWLKEVFSYTWPIIRKTLFVDDCVFSDSSMFPVSVEHALWLAEEKNSLKEWNPQKEDALAPTLQNLEKVFKEKEEAELLLDKVQKLLALEGKSPLRKESCQELIKRFDFFRKYAKGFWLIAKAFMICRVCEAGISLDSSIPKYGKLNELVQKIKGELEEYEGELRGLELSLEDYPINLLLDADRFACFRKDFEKRIAKLVS